MTKNRIVLCCLLSLFTFPVLAQKEGIRFSRGSWVKALDQARENKKLIFVYVYTTWSESCRKMNTEIFRLKEVGEKYNTQFINYRVDADWSEGISFTGRYQVLGYPTYLFINGDGDVVYKGSEYNSDPKRFLSLADTALYIHAAKQSLPEFQAAYQSKKDDKVFMMEYLSRLAIFDLPEDTINMVLGDFFSRLSPSELKDTVVANILLRSLTTVQSPAFEHIMANQSFYKGITSELPLKLGGVIVNSYRKAIAAKNDPLFWAADTYSDKVEDPLPGYPYLVFLYRNEYYLATNQIEQMIRQAPAFMDSICRIGEEGFRQRDQQQYDQVMQGYISGRLDSTQIEDFEYTKEVLRTSYSRYVASVMNKTADLFLQYAQQKEDLRKACIWAARSVDMDMYNFAYYATLSQLYAKVGMKQEAVSTMEAAIELAKEQGISESALKGYRAVLKSF